jgi:plasmid segregation protein ParM
LTAVEHQELIASDPSAPVSIGLDDGFAVTKIALPNGRLFAVPSRARVGRSAVTWLDDSVAMFAQYETDATVYSVGEVDAAPTQFDGYVTSGLNRAIVQHALQAAGLAGCAVHAISGLPVSGFYAADGTQRIDAIDAKRDSLQQPVRCLSGALPAEIAFHQVIPEALAAWYDYVIDDSHGEPHLDTGRAARPVAIVDIGGRTTDYVVVMDRGIVHRTSGSLRAGLLDVKLQVGNALQTRFALETLDDRVLHQALERGVVRLSGIEHDISALVDGTKRELVETLHAETRRRLGSGVELDQILFVGGGAVVLADLIGQWFSNQVLAPLPAFANARGMLKYLRYVCDEQPV